MKEALRDEMRKQPPTQQQILSKVSVNEHFVKTRKPSSSSSMSFSDLNQFAKTENYDNNWDGVKTLWFNVKGKT